MSELRDYQERMLKSKKKIVICNWKRGSGKTTAVNRKIQELSYKYNDSVHILFIGSNINNIAKNVEYFNYNKSLDYGTFSNSVRGRRFDYIIIDGNDYVNNSIIINNIYKSMINVHVKQIFIMQSDENNVIDYISDDYNNLNNDYDIKRDMMKALVNNSVDNFKELAIKKLLIEFSKIEGTEKNTLTREKIIDMVLKLKEI